MGLKWSKLGDLGGLDPAAAPFHRFTTSGKIPGQYGLLINYKNKMIHLIFK